MLSKNNISIFLSISLIFISIIPIWFFENFKNLNVEVLLFLLSYILFFIVIYILLKKSQKINSVFFSILVFYGIDNKIGFWTFFGDFFTLQEKFYFKNFLNYSFSLIFSVLCIFLIYKLLAKDFEKAKKFFLFIITSVLIFNIGNNYYKNFKYQTLKEFSKGKKEYNYNDSVKKNKLLILLLDEMVGYGGISKDIKYGKKARQSQISLYNKYGFKGFLNTYSIYRNTSNAVSSMLNFDYNYTNYNGAEYFSENINDRYTKWSIVENKFFEEFSGRKILTLKNKAINYCNENVNTCLRLSNLNLSNNYIKNFNFSSFDYFLKKMKKQKSIFFQYFWRFLHELDLTNDYVDFVFGKVYFKNNLKYLNKILTESEHDLYFVHYLFPHGPMALDIDKSGECIFNKNFTKNDFYKDRNQWLSQHYKEIICTNKYLDNFFSNLEKNKVLKYLDVLILSDAGLQISLNKNKKTFIRDAHSVVFALKSEKVNNEHSNEFVSSQELFSRYFNKLHEVSNEQIREFRVFDINQNNFIRIEKFED